MPSNAVFDLKARPMDERDRASAWEIGEREGRRARGDRFVLDMVLQELLWIRDKRPEHAEFAAVFTQGFVAEWEPV